MKYFVKSNLTTLRRNLGVYLPTGLLLTAGMAVLFFILCGVFSFYDDLNDRMRNVSGLDIRIVNDWYLYKDFDQSFFNFRKKGGYIADEDSVLMLSDLELIKERFGDSIYFKASLMQMGSTLLEEGGERIEYHIAYLSDDYFRPFRGKIEGDYIMGTRKQLENFAFLCSPEFRNKQSEFFKDHFPLIYDAERGVFTDLDGNGEIHTLAFEDVTNLDEFDLTPFISVMSTGEAREPAWDTYLFIPMKYLFPIFIPNDNAIMTLRASAENYELLYEMLHLLHINHKGKMTYVFDETSSTFLQGVREQRELIAVIVPVTLILLLVIGMSFTGLQLMSVRRRSRDFAIQMTCGARRVHILGGALLLVLITVTSSAVLSAVIGSIAVQMLEIRLYNVFVTVKWMSFLPVLIFGWLIGIGSCLPTLLRLKKMSPMDILSEL